MKYFKTDAEFPVVKRMKELYPAIRADTELFLRDAELDRTFLTLTSTATKSVKSQAQDWKTLPMMLHGEDPDDIRQRYNMRPEFKPFHAYIKQKHFLNCRKALLEWAHEPANGIVSLWFSYFEAGCKLGLHTNDDPYMYRAHMGVIVPNGDAAFKVCDEVVTWKEGEILVFDSCNPHTAWNLTDQGRMLLVADFLRPELPREEAVAMEREQFHRMLNWNPESMGMSGGYRDLPRDVIQKYAVPGDRVIIVVFGEVMDRLAAWSRLHPGVALLATTAVLATACASAKHQPAVDHTQNQPNRPGSVTANQTGAIGMTQASSATMDVAEFHRRRRFVDTLSGRIAYVEQGNGPVAIFVHGVPLNGFYWRHILAGVGDVRRGIALDLMGLGYSEIAPDQPVSFEAQARMIAQFADALGIDQFDLVANDSGGAIAQIFAVNNPHRLRTLTLTNCDTHDNWPPPQVLPRLDAARQGTLADAYGSLIGNQDAAHTRLSIAWANPKVLTDEVLGVYFKPLVKTPERKNNFHRYWLSFDNAQTVQIEAKLKALKVPTLIVWGLDDVFFDVKWAYWLRDTIPGATKVVEVPGAKLFFAEDHPEALLAPLRDFLASSQR